MMLEQVLRLFQSQPYALTLVSDPDNVLADETVWARLAEQGFSLLHEDDPLRLRVRLEEMGGFSLARPLLLITSQPLDRLPYDLWQQGQRVSLALHTFFPHFSYPLVQALTPAQRRALSQQPAPAQPLGREESAWAILRALFGFTAADAATPAAWVAWLNRYHASDLAPLPLLLAQFVQEAAAANPALTNWPLAELLADRRAFASFVKAEWQAFVQGDEAQRLGETSGGYHLAFAGSSHLQDTLPQLVRSGVLPPVPVTDTARLPYWAQVAVVASPLQVAQQQADALLRQLAAQAAQPDRLNWSEWKSVAATWAHLVCLRYQSAAPLDAAQQAQMSAWQARLDEAFLVWLRQHYAPLGGHKLPLPGHLHHVPHYLAYRRRSASQSRCALLVLDGMSLADWLSVRDVWAQRHPAWRMREQLLLAQLPTITAISRQALISGLRPADFAGSLHHNNKERKQWVAFWQQEDLPANTIGFAHLNLGKHPQPAELSSPRLQSLCLIHNGLDEIVHHASLGAVEAQASLRLWLQEQSPQLEAIMAGLLQRGFAVYLTSDHGHVEAEGRGQPNEGSLVQTRSKRARVYESWGAAVVPGQFPGVIRWQQDGLLPDGVEALLAGSGDGRRLAFAPANTVVVTHGGATLDEVVVPFVEISL